MEFFRAGEALIRSSQPLLLPFLAPTAYRPAGRIGAASKRYRPQQWQCLSARTFATSQERCQQSNAAASEIAELADSMRPQRRLRSEPQEDDLTAELLDSTLDHNKHVPGAPTGRTSRFASNTAQQRQRPTDSVDEFLMGMTSNSPQRRSPSNPSPARPNPQVDQTFADMLSGNTSSSSNPTLDVENILSTAGQTFYGSSPAPTAKAVEGTNTPADFKLDSTTGRVIHVDGSKGIDAARAFRMLGSRLAQNNVKRDFQQQRFHERPGLRRKRLKTVRWRKRFREAFQTTVEKVVGMKRMGW